MSNLLLKKFEYKESLNEQRVLFNDAFPEVKEASVEDYYWLLQSFPGDNAHSYEYSAHIDNEMVGFYAAIPYKYKIQTKVTNVGMVCGVMTSSKHRGKGIFTKLGTYSLQDLKNHVFFTTGFPIRKEVIPGHLKVGWKIAFELPLYIKFLEVNSLLKNKFKYLYFLSPIANSILFLYNRFFNINYTDHKYSIQIYDNIPDYKKIDLFESNWQRDNQISLIRDEGFLKWRYNRPNTSYRFVIVQKEDKICGFCSYRKIIKEGVPSYGIMDLRVHQEDIAALNLIYQAIEEEAKKENIEAILLMISKLYASKYKLIKNGFLRSPFKFHLILNNLSNTFSDSYLLDETNWHLMWVDSDDL